MTEARFHQQLMAASPSDQEGIRADPFFNGPAGTGKTHLARKIAKGLGLPLIKLNLEGSNYELY